MESLSIVLGVVDEVKSLEETVVTLIEENFEIVEIIAIVAKFTTLESLEKLRSLSSRYPGKIKVLEQTFPGIGGAYQTGITNASGTLIILMSSDLETNPKLVKEMLKLANIRKDIQIIAASRWLGSGGFIGYKSNLYVLNFLFQKFLKFWTGARISDFTYAFRLYRSESIKGIAWSEAKHGFFLESLLRPLAKGAKVLEIPATWTARSEGQRHINFRDYFTYLKVAKEYKRYR